MDTYSHVRNLAVVALHISVPPLEEKLAASRQRIRGCRHRNAAAAGEIAYRRVNVRCVTPLGDETASMS
jgi:hypothetical protein